MTRVYGHSSHGKSTSPNVTNGDHRNNGHEHDDADLDAGRFLLKEKAKLPTADVLKTAIDEDEDPARIAAGFVLALGKACGNGEAFADLFWEDGVWRDRIVFTMDYRTFIGQRRIRTAAKDLLFRTRPAGFTVITPLPKLNNMPGGLNYIQVNLSFDTIIATATAVVNLIKTAHGWKAWTMSTMMESLLDYPELPAPRGGQTEVQGWQEIRDRELEFEDRDPDVLIIGGGQCGLLMAARLEALGVSYLLVERDGRIGDSWRTRYAMLSLHSPHWADQLPYLCLPSRWPTYTPAAKHANWLESYADALDLKYWTGCTVVGSKQDPDSHEWTIQLDRSGKEKRTIKTKHIVMATGFAGAPKWPKIKGMEIYKKEIRHAKDHNSSKGLEGKRMLVVGSGASGLDIALEASRRGVNVTLLQRSPTYVMSLTNGIPKYYAPYKPGPDAAPIEVADRLRAAMPLISGLELLKSQTKAIAEEDKDLLDGLREKGYKTWLGIHDAGWTVLGAVSGAGFYFEQGAGAAIIDGSIGVRHESLTRFESDKVVLSGKNGEEREDFDIVIMATGYHGMVDTTRRIMGDEIAYRLRPMLGIDKEGEISGAFRNVEVPNLWFIMGGISVARLESKMMALRIKAMLEGIAPEPYLDT